MPAPPRCAFITLILALGLVLAGPPGSGGHPWPGLGGAAWADDDDGGDDDGDDGSPGGPGGSVERGERDDRPRPRSRLAPSRPGTPAAPRAATLPQFAPEIVVRDLTEADLAQLLAEGYALIEARPLPGGSGVISRLAVPRGTALEAARARVRRLPSAGAADFNHYYRTGQGADRAAGFGAAPLPVAAPAPAPCRHANCDAWALVGWPADRATRPGCAVTVPVGVIDTGVNLGHELLAGARVERLRVAPEDGPPSGEGHGTAVVSLLVGASADRVAGLVAEAEVVAIDVFTRAAGDERADVVALIEALETLADRGVRLVNLSLAGPQNTVLDEALTRLAATRGMLMVAAAGNGGPQAPPAWPAAHPAVLAITAVDRRGRPWAAAQRGAHLDLAAPGVDLTVATAIRGARARSGTSFAVPFVTAAAAVMMSRRPGLPTGALVAQLRAAARDLGAEGRDPLTGWGLLSAGAICD